MKNTIFLAAGLLLSFAAVTVSADEKKEVKCAVMPERSVNVAEATKKGTGKGYADYKGNRYFFCCGGCPTAFAKDPAKFAKADHIPTPKATKPAKKS